ncbi:hypothetical protein [Serratia sp. JSRIV006]|uniref:hypothetical protein n=1 Tax=Serratia sp. JSRIV006 TaxID=2831896 RepID=UPI001CC1804B|nr:hypothetical protein [Serratia sp. JSRIV006]UAN61544.1 hypothetical protein KGP16_18260 [Serratia sp. JSRIV006]
MDYAENASFSLDGNDAERLITLGVVADVAQLRQQAVANDGPTITVADGVQVNRGP